jgi:glucose/arabinose dehydrogenase
MRTLRWLPALVLTVALLAVPSAGAVQVPSGFQARVLPIPREAGGQTTITGLRKPTTLTFGPDGEMFVGDWFGRVKVFDSVEDTTPTLALTVVKEVHSFGDRGLLGMELDPEYKTAGHNYIYLSYAYDVPLGSAEPPNAEYGDGGDDCENVSPYTDCEVSGRVVRIALDPATGVAADGAVEPPQQELVRSWCQQFNSHSMGDIEFDSSGALLVTGGEGANYSAADYGQFANPCGDPVDEGGSLRAQDVRTPGDPTDYSGAIIRVDRETGEALDDNPLFDSTDVAARRILAYGMRNPYRFEVRPGTDEVFIADVGQYYWEELNRVISPPATGQSAPNFGWPCYEGGNASLFVLNSWNQLDKPLCESLYDDPSQVTASFWGYPHGTDAAGHLFSGDECNPNAGAAFSGLAFYEAAAVPDWQVYPAGYHGALFMADAARGCVWAMHLNDSGELDPASITNFATSFDGEGTFTPVDVVQGPEGALYMPNFYDHTVEQIRYFGDNEPPVAALEADEVDGNVPLTVHFDAGASSDVEGDDLTYAWDLDGDGSFDDGSDSPTAEATYTTAVNVMAKVRVSDEFGRSDVASLTIYPGDLGAPVATIVEPLADLDWAIGDTIEYEGTADDPDPGGDADLAYHWEFNLKHCTDGECHTHPYTTSDAASGSLVAPPHEYPSHLSLELTVTDSRGRESTVTREIFPREAKVTLSSDPVGAPLDFDGKPASGGPFVLIAGGTGNVSAAPTAVIGGQKYVFASWSDGGAISHQVKPLQDLTLVAKYVLESSGGGGDESTPPTTTPPVTIVPPVVAPVVSAKVSLVSKPAGVKLRLGAIGRKAPFALPLPIGTQTTAIAPAKTKVGGRALAFRGWKSGGKLIPRRRLGLTVKADARLVALYRAR